MNLSILLISKKTYLFRLLFLLFCFSCNIDSPHYIFVDNPWEEDMKVKINETEHDIPAFGSLEVNLKSGTYQVVATINDSCFFNESITINTSGLLNVHKENYVLWSDLYATANQNSNQISKSDFKINGNLYKNVDFIIYPELNFIPKKWDLNLNETWEENLNYYFLDTKIRSKIYRISDLEKEFGFGPPADFTEYKIEELTDMLNELESNKRYD